METKNINLKLNYKRTLIIGFAFFSILMVWQAYNFYCPLFLEQLLIPILAKNNISEYNDFIIGFIMALDNVLALFMLPIFGKLSDKTNTRFGKRMPYIIVGMILTCIAFPFIILCYLWDSLIGLIIVMLMVLVIMNMYRNPAVALMPDVTPKPLRSTANGLVNLVGYFGPILITVVNMIPAFKISTKPEEFKPIQVIAPTVVVLISVILAMLVLIFKIKENKILKEMEPFMARGEQLSLSQEKIVEDKPLSKKDRKNMWILLIAVCLWFMSFNAIETFNSKYFNTYYSSYQKVENLKEFKEDTIYYVLEDGKYIEVNEKTIDSNITYYTYYKGSSIASMSTIILTISSVITFAVAGYFAVKFGRKPNVLVGVACLIVSFLVMYFIKSNSPIIYLLFFIAGVGWALINVNSYPMMVEISSSKDVGKYTGYYYTASMLAQSITPILLGAIIAFIPGVTLQHLFIYTSVMAMLAFIVISFFKESKTKVKEIKTGLSAIE